MSAPARRHGVDDITAIGERLIAAIGERVEKPIDLEHLTKLERRLKRAQNAAVARLRERGYSDSDIEIAARWPR